VVATALKRGHHLQVAKIGQFTGTCEDHTAKSLLDATKGLFRYLRGEPFCPGHLTTIESRTLKLGLLGIEQGGPTIV
jgi:hypothetical protein